MEPPITLDPSEQASLLHAIGAGIGLADVRQLESWARGPLLALLPHDVLVCMRLGSGAALLRIECLHGPGLAPHVVPALADRRDGLALRIARHCVQGACLPALGDFSAVAKYGPLRAFGDELRALGFGQVLVHGTGRTWDGASVFLLFGAAGRLEGRHADYLELLLPSLHLALSRLAPACGADANAPARGLSLRETEIVRWLGEGKSNEEVGRLLGISGMTVKNHLQRIYRVLGVSNRAHALRRCMELRLLERLPF